MVNELYVEEFIPFYIQNIASHDIRLARNQLDPRAKIQYPAPFGIEFTKPRVDRDVAEHLYWAKAIQNRM